MTSRWSSVDRGQLNNGRWYHSAMPRLLPVLVAFFLLGCPARSVNGIDDVDDDGDGFSEADGDCDDANPAVHPDAEEIIDNDIDDDCNGTELITPPRDDDDAAPDDDDTADDDDVAPDDDDATPAPLEGDDPGECEDGADNDVDGLYDCADPDCAGAPACAEALNTPPTAPVVAIVPPNPHSTHALTCVVQTPSEDADGDPVTYSWAWAVDAVDQGVGDVTVPASATSTGETWTCTVTPSDPFEDGPPGSAAVTVTNEPPSAPGVAILPAVPITTDDLTCFVETQSVDPEGQAVTYSYAWEVDGLPSPITDATVPAAETLGAQTWSCTVTPNDGGDDGPPGSASVTIDVPVGCWDGSVEFGVSVWGRADIVYCRHSTGFTQPPAIASLACNVGWHICTGSEFVARNDSASDPGGEFTAVIDDGPDCAVRWTNTGCFDLASDYAVGNGPQHVNPSSYCPSTTGYNSVCAPLLSMVQWNEPSGGPGCGQANLPGNCGVL